MTTDKFLADTFEKLANDPSWPQVKALLTISCWPQPWQTATSMKDYQILDGNGDIVAKFDRFDIRDAFFSIINQATIQSPLTMARLALMVVEERSHRIHDKYNIDRMIKIALSKYGISPNHYANLKKRVADTEAK